MRRIYFRALLTALSSIALVTACEKYDDSALVARMDKAEADIKELQTLVSQINTTLSGLATTVDALQKQDRILSVTKLDDGSGYIVEFSQSGIITIYNGKNGIDGNDGTNGSDGTDGKNGETPTIGVKLDTDGNYYWTVNGEYLLDENGNKIAATAHVATPQLRINNGNFEISYNGGVTWEIIGEAGNTGAVVISKVEDKDDSVTFTLGDGTSIVVPKAQKFAINVSGDVIIAAGEMVTFDYSVSGADELTVTDAFGTKDFEVVISPSSYSEGSVMVTAPNPLTDGKIYMIAVKGDGTTTARILSCEEGVFILSESVFAAKVPAEGGTFEVPFQTNQEDPMVMVAPGYDWITYVETKSVRSGSIVFNIKENESEEERAGQVSINFMNYTIIQEGKTGSVSSGGRADLETFNGGKTSSSIAKTYTTSNGWVATTSAILKVLDGDNPRFEDVGTGVRPKLSARSNGKYGVLTSPVLTGGCGTISIDFARSTMETGSNFKIEILDKNGNILKSDNHSDNSLNQYERRQSTFDFNVAGEFQIVVTADKCANTASTTNDDFFILELSWTGYSE